MIETNNATWQSYVQYLSVGWPHKTVSSTDFVFDKDIMTTVTTADDIYDVVGRAGGGGGEW